MKSQNTKSSDELQKEVRHELRNVRRDIDELAGRLSPGQLIDDVIFYPHGRSPGATFDHLRRNPVGTAFLSIGTILLMEDESHQTIEALGKNKIGAAREKISEVKQKMNMHPTQKELAIDKINEFKDKMDGLKADAEYKVAAARDKLDTVKETVEQKLESAKGTVEQKLDSAKQNVEQKFDSATESFGSTTNSGETSGFSGLPDLPTSEEVGSLKNRVTDKVSGFMSSGKQKFHDLDNTTFMALGAGLGVLTGASLPVSDAERSFVDSKFQDKFSGFSGDLQSAINECSNILKDLVISDVKEFKMNLF